MAENSPQEIFDVVVVGSGAAGLAAALSAADAGARVCVLEKAAKFGGTTAFSGGVAWVPCNPFMTKAGATDTRELALEYLDRLSLGRTDRSLLEILVDRGSEALAFLDATTPLEFHALQFPDHHPEFPGGTFGRSVIADIFDSRTLGDKQALLQDSPHFPVPISLLDMERAGVGGALSDITEILSIKELTDRMQNGKVAAGAALIGGMLKSALDKGVDLRVNARAVKLLKDGERVTGVEVEIDGATTLVKASRGVILASGGFERNAELVRDFIRGPLEACLGAPSNEGDGQIMAMEAGAALGNMSEAWWQPASMIPGEEYQGLPFARLVVNERSMPGAIMVNRQGQRFVNEAHNYNDIGRSFHTFDPVAFDFPNTPAYVVMHKPRLDRSAFLTRFPTDPVPNWLIEAPSLRELTGKIGVDPDGLEATVKRFNTFARQGKDPDFQRGESRYDGFHGDTNFEGPFQTLGPIEQGPFYAMRVYSGVLGTKGGAKTDEKAQVLSPRGKVISGLYAAGNAMAGVTGMAYPGAGGTIGPALTFGYIAGRNAASANRG